MTSSISRTPSPSRSTGATDPKAGCAKIDGLAKLTSGIVAMRNGAPLPNQAVGNNVGTAGNVRPDGAYDRGMIEVRARANPDGQTFNVDVVTRHTPTVNGWRDPTPIVGNDDVMSLYLQTRVQDGAVEGILNLGVLAHEEPLNNVGAFDGKHTFKIAYDDVDAYLAKLNPHLKLAPGAQLAVYAQWKTGHEWGGFGRKGAFDLPRMLGAPTSGAAAGLEAAVSTASRGASLPLDISYRIPDALQAQYPQLLELGGEITTRLESEMKGEAPEAEVENAVVELYKLAHDKAAAEHVLGAGWNVVPVTRYWQKDASGNVIESPRFAARKASDPALAHVVIGEPDPLHDEYRGKHLLQQGWVVRLRSNETKAGLLNVKPGLGRLDPGSQIRQRIELGMTLAPGATLEDAGSFIQHDASSFNPLREELKNAFPYIYLPSQLSPLLELTAERHRFNLEHPSGVSVEVTCDFTRGRELIVPNPYASAEQQAEEATRIPRESYICGIEAELDHLNFGQANQGKAAGGAATSVVAPRDEAEQQTFASGLSSEATLFVPPRFHTTKDLDDDAFRTSDSYQAFEEVLSKLKGHLFPQGIQVARQKGQAAAIAMGLLPAPPDATGTP
jgi:hypothetical protein